MTRICPTCGADVPNTGLGRPRDYCSADCRREMGRLRRELEQLEMQLAEARRGAKEWPPASGETDTFARSRGLNRVSHEPASGLLKRIEGRGL